MDETARTLVVAALALAVLGPLGFWIGEHMEGDTVPRSRTSVVVLRMEVLSTRNESCDLMVKDGKTGITTEISPSGFCEGGHPVFEDGESVDMELWNQGGPYETRFVFKGDGRNREETYTEHDFNHKLADAYQ